MLDLITFGKLEQRKQREKEIYRKCKRRKKGIIRMFDPPKPKGKLN